MSGNEYCDEGREHVMFSALSAGFNQTNAITLDWCIRCRWMVDIQPSVFVKGQVRRVEDVPTEGLL